MNRIIFICKTCYSLAAAVGNEGPHLSPHPQSSLSPLPSFPSTSAPFQQPHRTRKNVIIIDIRRILARVPVYHSRHADRVQIPHPQVPRRRAVVREDARLALRGGGLCVAACFHCRCQHLLDVVHDFREVWGGGVEGRTGAVVIEK